MLKSTTQNFNSFITREENFTISTPRNGIHTMKLVQVVSKNLKGKTFLSSKKLFPFQKKFGFEILKKFNLKKLFLSSHPLIFFKQVSMPF